jgi:hypothetical protein
MTEPENEPDLYREWLAEKREEKAPDELADRVAGQLLDTQSPSQRFAAVPQWARAAILIAAAIGGLGRYVLLGIFILFS